VGPNEKLDLIFFRIIYGKMRGKFIASLEKLIIQSGYIWVSLSGTFFNFQEGSHYCNLLPHLMGVEGKISENLT
jgi:hypothetical protein